MMIVVYVFAAIGVLTVTFVGFIAVMFALNVVRRLTARDDVPRRDPRNFDPSPN